MKTILVIYTDHKRENVGYTKRYAFNTSFDVEVGDMLSSNSYRDKMQVVSILEDTFLYFNKENGDLTNSVTNANLYPIRNLEINESVNGSITANIIKE